MSLARYEQLESLIELYQKLGAAEKESQSNAPKISHKELMEQMREQINGQKVSD